MKEIAGVVVALFAAAAGAVQEPYMPKMIAHRGAGDLSMPEATTEAYSNAVITAADVVKLDLQCTKDGVVVLGHDRNLSRNMGWDAKVSDLTYDEIRSKGRYLKDWKPTDLRIVRLEEALPIVRGIAEFWIDFKTFSPEMVGKVFAAFDKEKIARSRIMVATFDYKALAYVKEHFPDVRRVAHVEAYFKGKGAWYLSLNPDVDYPSRDAVLEGIVAAKATYGLFGVNMPIRYGFTRESDVGFLHRNGLWASLWFVQDAATARRYRSFGADAYVTDAITAAREGLSIPFGSEWPPMRAETLSADKGVEEIARRFADTNVYRFVSFGPEGFDLGKTVNYPNFFDDRSTMSQRGTNYSCTAIVPCEQYVRAYVLCDVMNDPKRDPAFAIRLLRNVSAKPYDYLGRSFDSMAQETVDLAGRTGRQLVEVRMKTGEIEDIIFTDKRGDFNDPIVKAELKRQNLTNYLDLELIGRPISFRHPFRDMRNFVDPALTSGVRVLAVALERPAAEMEHSWSEPGNVFHNDEKPETYVDIRVNRPGSYRLVWTIRDDEGVVVKTESRPVGKTERLTVDLRMPKLGWYEIGWRLLDGKRTLLTHRSSFALLGKDTRKSGQGEAPYGCGCGLYQAHYLLDPKTQQETAGKLMLKLGMRRTPGIDTFLNMDQKVKDKYKLAGASAAELWPDQGDRPEEMKKMLDKRLAASPTSKNVIVLYESSPEPYRQAEELTGGVHVPTNGMKGAEKRVAGVRKVCEFLRKNYPDVKITLGNSLVCSELIAEQMRAGLPKDLADYMGSETVQRNNLPELMASSSIQTVDCYRELAKMLGYPWGVNSCQEHCYRLDTLLGEDEQAWWYVRDLVLMQCWRFPDIFLANTVDAGNHYTDSFWGNSGVNRRAPYLYPKKSYVALATATKVLDQVVSRRHVPTGDDCVHVVEFAKKDGSYATALWAVRGEAELELDLSVPCERVSLYGVSEKVSAGKVRQKVGEKMLYLVSPSPCVRAAVCRPRRAVRPEGRDYQALVRLNSTNAGRLGEGVFEPLERKPGAFPCRHAGKGVLTCVKDEEAGNVLELELTPMDEKLPTLVSEYATCFLKRPVPLAGAPATLVAWVKGNSGWGEFSFILRDRKGLYRVNTDAEWGDMEFEGLMAMNYSGWRALSFPLNARSRVRERSSGDIGNLWTGGVPPDDGSLELVGFAFDAHRRPLFLDERREKRQVIRIAEIGACDFRTDFENEHVAMTFDGTGRLVSLREKTGGRELVARPLPFVEVRDGKGMRIVPTGLSIDGERLRFSFPKGSCTLRLVPFKGGWTIETEAFDVPDAQRFVFGQVAPSCDRQMGWQSNAVVDDRSGVVLRGYTPAVEMGNLGSNKEALAPGGHVTAVWVERAAGFVGHRAGLAAGSYDRLTEMLRAMAEAGDVPRTACGGPWSQGAEANRRSYLFATWMDKGSVDDWLRLMEKAGSRTLHLHAWWRSRGHYAVDPRCFPGGMDDILDVCRRARARGFHVGTHSLCSAVGFGDPFIDPKWYDDFQTDAEYTLARPYRRGDTEIVVNERPAKCQARVLTGNTNGNFLRLGDDLLQYSDFTTEPPYRFTGIDLAYAPFGEEYVYDNAQAMRTTHAADENGKRTGARRRTLSRAEYPAGTRLSYLHHAICEFMPEPGSKLAAEVVKCLAEFFNRAELEGFYYDGSETWNTRESIDRMRVETLKAFRQPKDGIVNGAATGEPFYWWFRSLAGSWDHTNYAPKRFIDKHITTFATAARADFLQTDYGWWGIRGANATARGYFPDEAEYFGCKCAAWDSTISIQGAAPTDGPLDFSSDRQLTISGWWDRLRFARAFRDGLQARMRPLGDDNQYRLRQGEDGAWQVEPFASVVQTVSSPDFVRWTASFPAERALALRVESLYAADRSQPAKTVRAFDGTMFGETASESAAGMKVEAARRSDADRGETIRLEGRNVSAPDRASWCRIVRRLPLEGALKPTGVSSVWVKGDGSGVIANFQLRIDRAYGGGVSENVVKLDFKGWRRVDFVLREKNMDLASSVDWPYEAKYSLSTPATSYCYSVLNMPITEVSVYLNGIPKGTSAAVEFGAWDLLPMKRSELARGAAVSVNGESLVLPFALPSGDYAEYESGVWTHYAESGAPVERVAQKASPKLLEGGNAFAFSGSGPDGFPRVEVTAFAYAVCEPATGALSAEQRALLDVEWELPSVYAPGKGLSGSCPVRVRPDETARIGFEILGPAKNPSVAGRRMTVELKDAQERILCEDGRTWKAVRIIPGENDGDFRTKPSKRETQAEGSFASPLPEAKGGTTVFAYESETPGSRVSFFKRYRAK